MSFAPTYIKIRLKPSGELYNYSLEQIAPPKGAFVMCGPARAIWQVTTVEPEAEQIGLMISMIPIEPHRVPLDTIVFEMPMIGSSICELVEVV